MREAVHRRIFNKTLSASFESIKQMAHRVRSIDLCHVLEVTGAVKDTSDKAKWHTSKGTISISGPKFMNWSEGSGGGGAIDLAMHLRNFDFKEAVIWLDTVFRVPPLQTSLNTMPTQSILTLPKKDTTKIAHVTQYLVMIRSIPQSLIMSLIHSGTLYADTKGNAVFLLLGKEKTVVGAELRGTTHTPFRGMAQGSRKNLGFFCVQSHYTDTIVLVESAIDAISFFALYPCCLSISTSGASPNPPLLMSFINTKSKIYCGFDSDETGEKMAKKMIALYPSIKRLRPPEHDWNDVLKSKSKK
jgi:hypothetical protein